MAAPARLAAAAAAALLAGHAAHARVFSGKFTGANPPQYVGKFAFGVDPSGGNVGIAKLVYSNIPASSGPLQFLSYDDSAWGSVFKDSGWSADCKGE